VFAWSKSDLTGVHRSVIEHALNTDPKVKPKLQRQRPMSADRAKSAEAEVQKLSTQESSEKSNTPSGWPM
jgi:hypothetical protein